MSEGTLDRLELDRFINVSGTMTGLGASIAHPDVARAMAGILPRFVDIGQLQRRAGEAICRLTGAEAGFVTASCAAGISLAVAGAMTGADLAAIEALPDTGTLKSEVVLQMGHQIHYGGVIGQAVRLTGARLKLIGQATSCHAHHLRAALGPETAAALYVVSHHVVPYGLLPLRDFADICHERNVPVIVDAASEYDLRGFLEQGADIVLYSGHKFLSGPTSGLVAGRRDLVRAAYLQNGGIGRGMKVGKESIAGVMAALAAWERRDPAAVLARETGYIELWIAALAGRPGIVAAAEADPTGNPLNRLRITVDPGAAKLNAWDLADALAARETPIVVRDHEIEHQYFHLDPCNLHPGQEHEVAAALAEVLDEAVRRNAPPDTNAAARERRRIEKLLAWPD